MSHKADETWFESKRVWSERKDRILGSYITAYLPKIATQRSPILLVDGFAGPGRFDDGKPGSPMIVCLAVREALQHGLPAPVKVLCIESSDILFDRLESNLSSFEFAQPLHGRFSDHASMIERLASTHSTFLYVDPWTVEGLRWEELDRILRQLSESKMSVEVLLNFNAPIFVRQGLAALKQYVPAPDPDSEDVEDDENESRSVATVESLDRVLGTEEWKDLLSERVSFPSKVNNVTQLLSCNLRRRFAEVCSHAVVALPHHAVPKYYLVFASRHPHALRLMNDEVVKSRRTLADMAKPAEPTLFETRSASLVPDAAAIPEMIERCALVAKPRGDLIIDVIRQRFGDFASSEIRGAIERMLQAGVLKSETGRARINDSVSVWLATQRS